MAQLQKVSAVPFSLSRLMLFNTMLLHGTESLQANFMALGVLEVPLMFLYMTWLIFTADVWKIQTNIEISLLIHNIGKEAFTYQQAVASKNATNQDKVTCSYPAILDGNIAGVSDMNAICVGAISGRLYMHTGHSYGIGSRNGEMHLLGTLYSEVLHSYPRA